MNYEEVEAREDPPWRRRLFLSSLLFSLFFYSSPAYSKFQICLVSSLHDVPNSSVNFSELLEPFRVTLTPLCVHSEVDRKRRLSSSRTEAGKLVSLSFPFSQPSFAAAFHTKCTVGLDTVVYRFFVVPASMSECRCDSAGLRCD